MKKLAFLGPSYTFSERYYKKYYTDVYEPLFVKTLEEAILSVDDDTDALVPIENLTDGFVGATIDGLIHHDVSIIQSQSLPVAFAFMGDQNTVSDCYVQFKVQGQCLQFLKTLPHINIILTASNYDSYVLSKKHKQSAIVPIDAVDLSLPHILHVEDISFNETRFVTLSKKPRYDGLKSACIISPKKDEPGLLHNVLSYFKVHQINLTTIMSRPKIERIKSYYFYLEIELSPNQKDDIFKVMDELSKTFDVKWLGTY
jgi:prephenate dehydratase